MAVDIGSATGYLDLDISKFLASLNEANLAAQSKTKNLGNTLGDGLDTIGKKISGAGKTLTVGLTTPIVGAGAAAIKTTADFDKSMSNVQAISGATGKDFEALRNKAREMGAQTKFSASDAADAMSYMAMAGWKTNDMLSGVSGIMNLAAASGEDLATTSDIVTDALTAFGMSASDSGHFADVMAAASSNANTNVSMLGESFKYVAPLAGAMKYSAEDVSVALGLMANSGIKASQGGTSLRTVLTNMLNPTDEVAKAMDDLGISLTNPDGSMKSLREVMVDLRNGFGNLKISQQDYEEGLLKLDTALANGEITQEEYNAAVDDWINSSFSATDAQKAQTAAAIAGKTGLSGLLAIVNASEEDFNKLTNAVDNSSQKFVKTKDGAIMPMSEALEKGIEWVEEYNGEAEKMAAIMQDNLSGQLDRIKSGLQELAISFGDIMMPAIRGFADGIIGLVDKLNGLSEGQKKTIMVIAAVIAAVGPLLVIIGSVMSGVAGLIKNFYTISEAITKVKDGIGLLQPVFGGLSAPIVAVVAAIGILIAAFVTLWNTNEEFRTKVTEIFSQVQEAIANFVGEVKKRFDEITPIIEGFVEIFKEIWSAFCEFMAPIFIDAFTIMSQLFQSILDIIIGILDVFIGIFTGDWNKVWEGAKRIFTAIWNAIVAVFTTIASRVVSTVSSMVSSIGKFFSNMYNAISKVISNILNAIINWARNMASKATEAGRNFLNNVVKFISQLPGRLASIITNILSRLSRWVSQMRQKGADGAKSLATAVINGLKSLPSKMMSVGKEIVNGVWKGIQNARSSFYSKVKSFFSGLVSAAKGALGIHSPSKVFEEEVGAEIPPGAEKGIEKKMPALVRSTIEEFNDLVSRVSGSLNPIGIDSALNVARVTGGIGSISDGGLTGTIFNEASLQMLSEMLYKLLRMAPIENNVIVQMEDGDVILDNERVGRKVAPVVSRVQATGAV